MFRYSPARLAILGTAIALLAQAVALGPAFAPAALAQGTITVSMTPYPGALAPSSATLTDLGNGQTQVVVTIDSPLQSGTTFVGNLPCYGAGSPLFQLNPVVGNQSTTVLDVPFSQVLSSGRSVAVLQRPGVVFRCGDLPGYPLAPHDERYFQETGFRIDNDVFWDYFNRRGGIRTFGYPISRTFTFRGYHTQFFQRLILQELPGQGVQRLNLLDTGFERLMPYSRISSSQFPEVDPSVKAAAPPVGSPDYADQVVAFVREYAPNDVDGQRAGFFDAFMGTVTLQDAFPDRGGDPSLLPLLNLEIWGVPTSRPTLDPTNSDFVYLRFQRGIMHFQGYDPSGKPITEAILLADWFKSLITGRNLPSDLEVAAKADNSSFLRQYDPTRPNWVSDPSRLPNTDLTMAFHQQ